MIHFAQERSEEEFEWIFRCCEDHILHDCSGPPEDWPCLRCGRRIPYVQISAQLTIFDELDD